MSATFATLANTAAVNPKLLALHPAADREPRPRAMFLYPARRPDRRASLSACSTLVFQFDALKSQRTIGAGVDPALGLLLAAAP